MEVLHSVSLVAIVIVTVGLWVSALVSVVRTTAQYSLAAWVAVIVLFPVIGPIAWFWAGRSSARRPGAQTHGPHVSR